MRHGIDPSPFYNCLQPLAFGMDEDAKIRLPAISTGAKGAHATTQRQRSVVFCRQGKECDAVSLPCLSRCTRAGTPQRAASDARCCSVLIHLHHLAFDGIFLGSRFPVATASPNGSYSLSRLKRSIPVDACVLSGLPAPILHTVFSPSVRGRRIQRQMRRELGGPRPHQNFPSRRARFRLRLKDERTRQLSGDHPLLTPPLAVNLSACILPQFWTFRRFRQ